MRRAALRFAPRDGVPTRPGPLVAHPRPRRRPLERWRLRSGLDVAVGTSVVLAIVSTLALLGQPADGRVLRFLAALAAICLAVLALRRAPSVAWLAAIVAGGASATLWFDRARPFAGVLSAEAIPWVVLATIASVWAIATAAITARYATRPGERIDPVAVPLAIVAVGWLVVGCLTTVGVVLAGQREPDPAFNWIDVATVPVSVFLPLLLGLVGLGAAADVRSAARRATARMPAGGQPDGDGQRLWHLAILTGRELVPGQAVADEVAHDAERSRLAGDLHAVVVPSLRRAIAEAESGVDLDALSRHLRAVDREIERLMADRWPVVLEAFGIVRALEDLAERLEADGAPPIAIDVTRGSDVVRQPPAVERAAWRFAEIALDNAVRHADPGSITVSVDAEAQSLRLSIADDGPGMPAGTGTDAHAGRGLIDAKRRAADVGGTVGVESDGTSGTVITFEWRAPGGA
jgi:signal transduction histidine kinase